MLPSTHAERAAPPDGDHAPARGLLAGRRPLELPLAAGSHDRAHQRPELTHHPSPRRRSPTAGPTESPTEFPPRPQAVHIRGLPEQGVAVEHDGGVDLHNVFDGGLVDHLDGFAIYDSTAPPSHLVLERDGWYYLLDEFRRALLPLRSERAAHRFTGSDQGPIDDPAPTYQGKALTGHWRYITYNPRYSDQEMGQWSGECEVPTAFFIEEDEGEVVPVTGRGRAGAHPGVVRARVDQARAGGRVPSERRLRHRGRPAGDLPVPEAGGGPAAGRDPKGLVRPDLGQHHRGLRRRTGRNRTHRDETD